jgi:hypothetical protein
MGCAGAETQSVREEWIDNGKFLAFSIDGKLAIFLYCIRTQKQYRSQLFWKGAMDETKESSHRKGRREEPDVDTETLNFKVTTEFKKEFKGYAVSLGITMLELLKEGFELSKQKRRR